MYSINLRDLFTLDINKLPNFVHFINVIYRIHNLINNKSYIGQTTYFLGRFRTYRFTHLNELVNTRKSGITKNHLYNSILKYKSRNFEVVILEHNVENLDERESYYIKEFDSYNNGYNLTEYGRVNYRFIENGVAASIKIRKLKWPETNGLTPWICGDRSGLLRKYPGTNGCSPEFTRRGREALLKCYPDTNGVPPQWIRSGIKVLKEKYKDTNGAPPQNIKKWNNAGREANISKMINRSYEAFNIMIDKLISEGHHKFSAGLWRKYKI